MSAGRDSSRVGLRAGEWTELGFWRISYGGKLSKPCQVALGAVGGLVTISILYQLNTSKRNFQAELRTKTSWKYGPWTQAQSTSDAEQLILEVQRAVLNHDVAKLEGSLRGDWCMTLADIYARHPDSRYSHSFFIVYLSRAY